MSDLADLRSQFPMLATELNGRPLVYLDNAATMQVPKAVTDAVVAVMATANANVHRGAHVLSQQATDAFEASRDAVARFLGCDAQEVVLASGTTDGLNKLAAMLRPQLGKGDRVVVTAMEHHSNLLPWRAVAAQAGSEMIVAPARADGSFDEERLLELIDGRTKVVAVTQLSNVSGISVPMGRIVEAAHEAGAIVAVDGAQGAAHGHQVGARTGCDAYAFSGHKLGAPTGTGALYVRKELLDGLTPATFGGGAIAKVGERDVLLRDGVGRFEPGTPNYQGASGLAAALGFWEDRDRAGDLTHEAALLKRLEQGVESVPGLHVVAAEEDHAGAVSLWLEDGTSYDVCRLLDAQGVATRSGHHCAQPYLNAMGLAEKGVLRVSVAPYNTPQEIDRCLEALERICALLGR